MLNLPQLNLRSFKFLNLTTSKMFYLFQVLPHRKFNKSIFPLNLTRRQNIKSHIVFVHGSHIEQINSNKESSKLSVIHIFLLIFLILLETYKKCKNLVGIPNFFLYIIFFNLIRVFCLRA